MTREHKLALIVGFSLILLVGVLISDHLSRARQAKVSPVADGETLVADASLPPPTDPLKVLNEVIAQTPPAQPQPEATPPINQPQIEIATIQQPAGPVAQTPAGSLPQEDPAVTITQRTRPSEDALLRAVEENGGRIVTGPDGKPTIELPGAWRTTTVPVSGGAAKTQIADAGKPPVSKPNQAPPSVAVKLHAVQKGETLFQIASKYYGTGHVWRELAKYNGVSDKAGVVRVGAQLKIPAREVLASRQPAPASPAASPRTITNTPGAEPVSPGKKPAPGTSKPGRIELATYTVKKGDTLGVISQKVLGTSKRWQEIASLNKIKDQDSINAGMVLKVPTRG